MFTKKSFPKDRHCLVHRMSSTLSITEHTSDAKSQLIGKDPNAGKDRGQEKKGVAEDEMVR